MKTVDMARPSHRKLKNVISCAVFLLLTAAVFILLTYLFRPAEHNGRKNILAFYEEKPHSLDVVALGASGTYRYFDPMVAWDAYGFASFDYSVASLQGSAFITALEDIYRTQSPRLIVADARRFTTAHTAMEMRPNVQRYFDCLDINPERFKAIYYFCSLFNIGLKDSLKSYLDLIQYHDNYYALWNRGHWSRVFNRGGTPAPHGFKGFLVTEKVKAFDEFPGKVTEEARAPADPILRIYTDFLDYCEEKGIEVLLVVTPCGYDEETMAEINYIEGVAGQRGFPFLNLNTHEIYEDIGIDFVTDYYDEAHMNVSGAEKYTRYISDYIHAHYDLPDHREDAAYASWHAMYEKYRAYADEKIRRIRFYAQNGYYPETVPGEEAEDQTEQA